MRNGGQRVGGPMGGDRGVPSGRGVVHRAVRVHGARLGNGAGPIRVGHDADRRDVGRRLCHHHKRDLPCPTRASALDGGASVTMKNVLAGIGNTPLVELTKVVPSGCARIVAKLEWANPTGSMKDRMAKAAIEAAEASGRLAPGGTVVEYTAGTTGISLAFVCAAKGYSIEIVFSDAFSAEKRRTMQAFGARVTD